MQTSFNLTKYEGLYDSFDLGHDKKHLEEVRNFAVKLAKKYCPNKTEVVYVSATLHDVGLSVNREGHEHHGYKIIQKDEKLKSAYTNEEYSEILEAVKEHRASTGDPKSLVARIVSDADKVSDGTKRAFQRAYKYGVANYSNLSHKEQILRAANHLYEKFGPNGTGTRVYFEESRKKLDNTYKPIFNALKKQDLKQMENFLCDD